MGYVYIMKCGERLKIGVSKDPHARLKTLQTGNPEPIELVHMEEKNDPYSVEKYVHRQLQQKHKRGEWFEGVTLREARVALLLCTDYD